ncbi:MAG: glycosyltransferase family 2 protein [Mycobacteriales bacterium]
MSQPQSLLVDRRRPQPAGEVLAGSVSVVIACHSDERLDQLQRCVESALTQEVVPREIVIAVDNNDALYQRLIVKYRANARVRIVANVGAAGASATRNCGVGAAEGSLIAFLDDDVVADPSWLRRLIAPLADATVVGTGGAALPEWQGRQPRWFPEEFLWIVGASFKGMPQTTAEVRNVWSENMAVRRAPFLGCGGFREGFGKHGEVSRPEDTEMCIRFARRSGDRWLYVPEARVDHFVPERRSTFRFFVRRCHNEGRGKIEMKRITHDPLSTERSYAFRTIPAALARYALQAVRGDAWAVSRFAAVVIGSVAALIGALQALARPAPQPEVVAAMPQRQSNAG